MTLNDELRENTVIASVQILQMQKLRKMMLRAIK